MQPRKPGDLVFVRVPTFPWWPAVVGRDPASGAWEDADRVWVYFFGDSTGAWAPPREIRPFTPADQATTARLNYKIPRHRRHLKRIRACCELALEFEAAPRRPLADYSTRLTVDGLVQNGGRREDVFAKYCGRVSRDELVRGEDAGNTALADSIRAAEETEERAESSDSDLLPARAAQTFGERLAARRAAQRMPAVASPPPVERIRETASSSTGSGSGGRELPRSVSLQSVENLHGTEAQTSAGKKRSKRKRAKSTRLDGLVNPLGDSPTVAATGDDSNPRSSKRRAGVSVSGTPRPVGAATNGVNGLDVESASRANGDENMEVAGAAGQSRPRHPGPSVGSTGLGGDGMATDAPAPPPTAPHDDSPVSGDARAAPRTPWASDRRGPSATGSGASSVNGESFAAAEALDAVPPAAAAQAQSAAPGGDAAGEVNCDAAAELMRDAIESLARSTEDFARSRGYDTGRISRDIDSLFPTPGADADRRPGHAYARSLARSFVWTAWKRHRRM